MERHRQSPAAWNFANPGVECMNQNPSRSLKSHPGLSFQPSLQSDQVGDLFNLLAAEQKLEAGAVEQLQDGLERCSFCLGDEIPVNRPLGVNGQINQIRRENLVDNVALNFYSDLYWVAQGRVRILGQDADSGREATAVLLDTLECFGGDSFFDSICLPYRAVAASPVQLLRVRAEVLVTLLSQYPLLHRYLQREHEQRQQLIFFKTQTELRTLSSHQLTQMLPALEFRVIPEGTCLVDEKTCPSGRYWLRSGQIGGTSDGTIISVGAAWGHPDPIAADWVAQTPLHVYQLPLPAWKPLAPLLTQQTGTESRQRPSTETMLPASSDQVSASRGAKGVNYLSLPNTAPPSVAANAKGSTRTPTVLFPKPTSRRLLDWLDQYPWVEQQSSSDCGAACLAMISQYWGKRFPVYLLREQSGTGQSGTSLRSLARSAESLGYHSRPVRASLGRLAEQQNPWIAHWDGIHYVVVYQIKGKRAIIADPAIGRRSLALTEFQAHWTGYALLLDPTEQLQSTEFKSASLGRYLRALSPYRATILQIILLSILIQVFSMVTPLFTQIILDRVVVQRSLSTLNVFAVGLLLFSLAGICFNAVRQYLLSYFSNRLDLTLISGFISHTLMLPLRFFEARRVGDIITRVQENQKIQRFLVQQVMLAWLNLMTGFLYLGLMLYYNWQLTLLVLGLIPPIVILTLITTPFLRRISREIFKETADQNSSLVEILTGIATVKSVAAERELRWCWEDHLTRQINTQFRGQKFGIGLQLTSGLIHAVGSTLLLWFGASMVIQDQLTIGQFVAFNMMIGYVISPVLALVSLWEELQEVVISVERLNDVFESQPEEIPGQPLLTLPTLQGEIRFEGVTFQYTDDDDRNVLQNVSFQAHRGQTIAIVGRSGSGKSTLAKLLQRLYTPTHGKILIDGHDISHLSPQSLRSQMGVVAQECYLFSGSILENITLYRSEFALEQVIEVAKLAEAHAFIQSLPLGYHTRVGERGSSLSGGQRQRIAIARALLGQPRLLILDEATSSLDTESERRFQQNLSQIRRDRTTFVIAHRLSTIYSADQILVLDRGVLVEQGNYQELMQQQGLFYYLAQQQLKL
jgi:ATP-binding cassette, subfamily B, bacterial HlyB/CyaB